MATETKIQTPHKNPTYIKITKNNAWIRHGDVLEIPAPMSWVRQYVEYMLATNQEIVVELVP